ncbi:MULTISPECIES: DUF5776 domain-containing protein [Levilactobacillus]|uniref:DUF5776 domain-containing protein n=1 Tax=Levilactobacillus TaxID=2767886 RepID=UPI0019519871|nr:DUF5776 domain-containing protein [Levilactobacillus sp. 244-2]
MLIQHRLLFTALVLSLCGTVGFFSAPTPANAATNNTSAAAQVAEVTDPGELTAAEAFGNDQALLQDVLKPVGNPDGQPYPANTLMKTILANNRNSLDISNPDIQDFQDLIKLKGMLNVLVIRNQTNLKQNNGLSKVLQIIDSENPLKLGLINDELTTQDFNQICQTIITTPGAIDTLNVSQNKITDFSQLSKIYNFKNPETNLLNYFIAWGQKVTTPLPAATVKNNTITLTPATLFAYQLNSLNQGATHGGTTQPDAFFYRARNHNEPDGTDDLTDTTPTSLVNGTNHYNEGLLSPPEQNNLFPDENNQTHYIGGDYFNSLNYDQSPYQIVATQQYASSVAAEYSNYSFTLDTPLSTDTKMYNIPSTTKSVQLRVMYSEAVGASITTTPGFTQDYEIPLNWSSTGNTATSSSANTTTTTSNSSPNTADTVSPKGTVVYATKKIGLYNGTNFTKKGRQHWYRKQPRINRPMFKVTGYANSTAGRPRYLVKDVNHRSKTAGDEGYITTQAAYVTPVYYRKAAKKITVINPNGVNAYRNKSLTGKATHYRQGQTLRVKKLVKHNLTTRYVLTNGRYITANKKLVQNGRVAMPKRLKAKTAINRYRDVNFKHRQKYYRKGTTLTVKGWDFSANGTKRYRVAHGYVTANRHFIKTIH